MTTDRDVFEFLVGFVCVVFGCMGVYGCYVSISQRGIRYKANENSIDQGRWVSRDKEPFEFWSIVLFLGGVSIFSLIGGGILAARGMHFLPR